MENDEIRYPVTWLPRTKTRYGLDDINYTTYINDPDKTIFLVYVGGQILMNSQVLFFSGIFISGISRVEGKTKNEQYYLK